MYKIFVAPIAKTSLTAPATFFISRWSVKNDTIAILPIRFVQDGFISYSEWAHSNELICKKFKLHIDEEIIDGRSKEAKELQHFSWLTVIKMYVRSSDFKVHAYKTITYSTAITIQVSDDGEAVRYKVENTSSLINNCNVSTSKWLPIQYDKNGNAYFYTKEYGRQYLSEFMKLQVLG